VIKKTGFVLMLFIFIILTGCGKQEQQKETGTNSIKPIETVVEHYLENTVENNWQGALQDLTGEALVETTVNKDRVKSKGKIIRKKFNSRLLTDNTAECTADFTQAVGSNIDRLAYKYLLIKSENRWKIYKTEWGSYIHSDLKPGQLPAEAESVIRQYVELTVPEKRSRDFVFLAGKLLDDSYKAKMLPQDNGKETKTVEKVKSIECYGVAEDYAVARVNSELTRDGQTYAVVSIVDLVNVNGVWKIASQDVAYIEGV